jgi:prepilin-type N-terminal cleavage/methylation domain-containing protein
MASLRPRRARLHAPPQATGDPAGTDGGFTLVEVVVALVLMSILMSAIAVLFVGGIRNSSGLQRRQAAVAVGAQAIEATRAVSVLPDAAGCVKLLQGRTAVAVQSQWAAKPSTVNLTTANTQQESAPAGCTGPVVIPLTGVARQAGTVLHPVTLNGLPYTVQTFIGSCRVPVGGSAQNCANVATGTKLYRVVVAVTWSGPGCGQGCQYTTSTLLDPSVDPVYNVRAAGAPTVANDALCFKAGVPAAFNVVANDTGVLGKTPVTIVTAPAHGTLGPTVKTGVAAFTPQAGYTGPDSFTYTVTDVNGLVSPVATATVTITNGVCP